jgi:hypothetical protein
MSLYLAYRDEWQDLKCGRPGIWALDLTLASKLPVKLSVQMESGVHQSFFRLSYLLHIKMYIQQIMLIHPQ